MTKLNILIVAHNNIDYVKLCIQSIRMFSDVSELSVVLIDNNSTDHLSEWAMEQDDIIYIQNDDENMPYGDIINHAFSMCNLYGDILLLDPHYLLTPHGLTRMINLLHEDENTAAVGPVSNCLYRHQACHNESISDYEKAILWSAKEDSSSDTPKVMLLSERAILIKESVLKNLGGLATNIYTPFYTIVDLCLQIISNDWNLRVCSSAYFWDSRSVILRPTKNAQDHNILQQKWGMHYFNTSANPTLIDMIHHDKNAVFNVLEIGCDCGGTLLEIHNQFPHSTQYGCEINPNAAKIASHFATVTVNNIEDFNLPYACNTFDYIIFGDVLEHLHDPYKTIEYSRSLLTNNGYIIASIPNLMHISVISELLNGNFTYTETGLLDKTHIHLFTYNEIIKMFCDCGYQLVHITPIYLPISEPQQQLIEKLNSISNVPSFMYESFQYVICAKKQESL